MRYVVIALAVLCLVVPGYFAWRHDYPINALADPVVLIVGDFSPEQPFARSVERGVKVGIEEMRDVAGDLRVVNVNLGPALKQKDPVAAQIQAIEEVIARNNVIAIISADTSQTAPITAAVGTTLRIPVLLAVATHARSLDHTLGWCFRLPASDTKQAATIAKWIGGTDRAAILYDLGLYGVGLRDLLLASGNPLRELTFQLGPETDMAGPLQLGRAAQVKKWVLVGYTAQATDFVAKKLALGVPGDVLLSDGCYGEWLMRTAVPAVLSFPTPDQPAHHLSRHEQIRRGFDPLGHDAIVLIAFSVKDARAQGGDRSTVRTTIASNKAAKLAEQELAFTYKFAESGENEDARFDLIQLKEGRNTYRWPTVR